jgi:hypothetical protein
LSHRLGDKPVKRRDDDARVTRLFHGPVKRVRRQGVQDDRVIPLKYEVLDLRGLLRRFPGCGREGIGGGDGFVRDGFVSFFQLSSMLCRQEFPA